ncbi:hypothetical protein RHGRI_028962 [Rhododendron griersonianum]|uniref:DUF4283 domain-containing protein n=1 Tax=Rhododendron griersonianum TaxID=479676 RepID=A0AAV6IHN7_9ERIC|nr:hypothetical protein RHGRI_028962 [Rhododendron griersonianum]
MMFADRPDIPRCPVGGCSNPCRSLSTHNSTPPQRPPEELPLPSLSPPPSQVKHTYTRAQMLHLKEKLPPSTSHRIIRAAAKQTFFFNPGLLDRQRIPLEKSGVSNGDVTYDTTADGIPRVTFSQKRLEEICKPWMESALILNLLGKGMGWRAFCCQVGELWAFEKDYKVIDVGSRFFVIRFEGREDYMRVFCGGPWAVMGHYLRVRKWEPNFMASEAQEVATARMWVRLPGLPIEYCDEEALGIIAKKFGKHIRIDITIDVETRARSARVCVEIELGKPLCHGFRQERGGDEYRVEYESTHSFCFNCGRRETTSIVPSWQVSVFEVISRARSGRVGVFVMPRWGLKDHQLGIPPFGVRRDSRGSHQMVFMLVAMKDLVRFLCHKLFGACTSG